MSTFSFTSLVARTKIAAAPLNTIFTNIQNIINNLDATNLAADCVGASEHADISSDTTNPYHAGAGIVMPAAGFGATNLSTQMGLVSAALGMSGGAATGLKYYGTTSHASDPTSATPLVIASGPTLLVVVIASTMYGVGDGVAPEDWSLTETVEYTISGAAAVDLISLIITGATASTLATTSTCANFGIITADATKTTTINFKSPVYTGGGSYVFTNPKIVVLGY